MADRVRTTVTGGFTTPHTTKYYTKGACNTSYVHQPTYDYITYSGVRTTKTIEDCVTPGFHSIVESGGFLPVNRVKISTVKETRTAGSGPFETSKSGGCYHAKYEHDQYTAFSRVASVPAVSESILDSLTISAVSRLKESMLDVLTTLAEMRDLVQLYRTTASRLQHLAFRLARIARAMHARYARRRRRRIGGRWFRRNRDPASIFAQLWLEYRYAWLPMIYTIQDALRALESSIQEGALITGTARQTESISNSKTVVTTAAPDATYTTTTVINGSRQYTVKAYGRINSTTSTKFAFDPLITGWELIPFSFVVDWFIGVGDFIQAWSPFSGVDALGISASTVTEYTDENYHNQSWSGINSLGSYTGCKNKLEVKEYVRSPRGVPALPTWNPSLSMVRGLDAVSLLYEMTRGVRRILFL